MGKLLIASFFLIGSSGKNFIFSLARTPVDMVKTAYFELIRPSGVSTLTPDEVHNSFVSDGVHLSDWEMRRGDKT